MKKLLTSLVLLIFFCSSVFAQNYPILSTVVISPPYSVFLSDYASASSNKLLVNLMLKDLNEKDVRVVLRLTIKGNGIEIKTKQDYWPEPIILQGGLPVQLSGPDLENYLNPSNLDFSGISKNDFIKTGKLPEGVYQFIVEAVESNRNVLVSNPGTTVGWLVLNDPPRWTLPIANSLLNATYPQSVFFSWIPMNTGSPNAAFTTEYEFTIVEIWPEDRSPGDAITSMIPLYQTTTANTSLVYGPAEPELTPGRKYVCRLRAYDIEGRDMFKNRGYSEILVFTFGQECKPPNVFNHQILDPEDAKVTWTSLPGNTQYILSYSEKNADGTWSNWYNNETIMPWSTITGLKPERTYRYHLKATCGTLESKYTDIKEFATPKKEEKKVDCGKDLSIPKVDGSPPLQTLKPGDKINVGGFDAIIVSAEGSNGTFSGKCVVKVKTFGGAGVLSEFQSIGINQSRQVTSGRINSVKGELHLLDVDAVIDSLRKGNEEEIVEPNENNNQNEGEPYKPGDVVTITYNGQTFTTTSDTVITLPDGKEIVVNLSGQPPVIIADGDTTKVTNSSVDLDNPGNNGNNGEIARTPSDTAKYSINYVQFKAYTEAPGNMPGFDAYDSKIPQILDEYKKKVVLEKEYIVPWQSVEANGKPGKVNMLIDTKVSDSINTRLKVEMNGLPITFAASPDGNTLRILNLIGQGNKQEDLITASYVNDAGSEIPVGYLNLVSYEKQTFDLVIVPVDGKFNYNVSSLQAYLNKIYGPAIVNWNVKIADILDVSYNEGEANGLNTSRSFMSSFNIEMKAVISAMENRGDYEKNTYYLFVMDKAENESLNGLMPFNCHFGFLFTGASPVETKIFRTTAHELGHGVFKLKHIFDDKGTQKEATQNLMDYTINPETATVLNKYQWDEIIDPRLIAFGWSEELYAEEKGNDLCESINSLTSETVNEYSLGDKLFYNQGDEANFNDNQRKSLTLLAYKLWCKTGLIINFVRLDDNFDFIRIDGGLVSEHWDNNFKNSKYNFTLYYGSIFFDLYAKPGTDKELLKAIGRSCEYIESGTGRDRKYCYIEASLNAAAKYKGVEIMTHPNCLVNDLVVIQDTTQVENKEEQEKDVEGVDIKTIDAITTFIDLEGNVSITWKNPNQKCQTKFSFIIQPNTAVEEIDLSNNSNDEYKVIIPKAKAGRKAIVKYNIDIKQLDKDILVFQDETGNFQGDDQGACPGQLLKMGNPENKNKTEYQYLWTDENDNSDERFEDVSIGYASYKVLTTKTLKLKRTKTVNEITVNDIGLVKAVVYTTNCNWELLAVDSDPPPGSGDRKVKSNGTLQVVKDPDYVHTAFGAKTIADYATDKYPGPGAEKPSWKVDNVTLPDLNTRTSISINTNKDAGSIINVSANAFEQTKNVNIQVFEKDKKEVRVENLTIGTSTASELCDMINTVNSFMDKWGLSKPFKCYVDPEVYSYNAEIFNSPLVIRDITGVVNYGISYEFDIPSIPPVGAPRISFGLEGGGAIAFTYDERKRIDSKPIYPPNEIGGSQIKLTLKLAIDAGVTKTILGKKVDFSTGGEGKTDINFDFRSTNECYLEVKVSIGDIVAYLFLRTPMGDLETEPVLMWDFNNNGEIDEHNDPFYTKCLIPK